MNNYSKPWRAGIVGFRGYSGSELVRLLAQHRQVEPVLLEHRQDFEERPKPLNTGQPARVALTPGVVKSETLALVFLATPADVSMELAPQLLAEGAKVIDLSGAFRFADAATYSRWYQEHAHRAGSAAPKPSMVCLSFAASASPAPRWSPTPVVIPRRRIWQFNL